MSRLVSDPIWGTPAIESGEALARDRGMRCLDSPRCGGYYAISREATYNVRSFDARAKARLTSWLVKERQTKNKFPEILTSTINNLKEANDMSISSRIDAILKYIKSKTYELGDKLVYDPTAATTKTREELTGEEDEEDEKEIESQSLIQFMIGNGLISSQDLLSRQISNEQSICYDLISCSECIKCDELNSLLEYIERHGWIEWKSEINNNKSCRLTVEGHNRVEAIQQETKTDSSISMEKIQSITDKDEIDDETIKVFISYSWDNENHKQWVKNLAKRLRDDGIEAILDQWQVALGDHIPHFMDKNIQESKYVLIICTPSYREKSSNRRSGVGYEDNVITSEIYQKENHRKFIPIPAEGSWKDAAPPWLSGKCYLDLSATENYEKKYLELRSTLLGERPTAPPVRRRFPNGQD